MPTSTPNEPEIVQIPGRSALYNDGFVNLTDCMVRNVDGAGVFVNETGTLYMAQSEIESCKFGIISRGHLSVVLTNFVDLDVGVYSDSIENINVSMSNFYQNRQYGIYNNAQIQVSAQYNFWDSAQGPSIYNYETGVWIGAGTRIWGDIEYADWALEENNI